jgi:Dolichyl-phosphate-mannose-protein mannosyltransferase
MTPLPDSVFHPERPSRPLSDPAEPPGGQSPESPRSWRSLPAWAGWTSSSKTLYVLAALVLVGAVLRVLASAAAWPTLPTLADSWPYAYYAGADVLANPQHPAGYSIFLALIGSFTHSVGVFVVLQHLMGIASALILFAAVRRLCGSPWPGVVGAAVILLSADQLYLEDLIMSETLFTLLLVSTVYATARALERPQYWWPWPALAAALAVLAGMTRTSGLFLIPVLALALLFAQPGPWLSRWRPLASFLGMACALLLCYATANAIDHGKFGVSPSPGWRLYAKVAPIADCNQFTPPKGTESLCQRNAPEDRFGPGWYEFDSRSPARRLFGAFGEGDGELRAFARQVILHQPRAYIETVLPDMAAYFFPSSYGTWEPGRGTDIDGQLSWQWATNTLGGAETLAATEVGMETFFSSFSVNRNYGLLNFFYDYQRTFRFGATLLVLATLLTLVGLCVGPRRNRIAVLVLGVSSLAIIVLPTLSAVYVGRYMVPPSGLLAAGAAIVAISLMAGRSSSIRRRVQWLFTEH